MSIQGGPNKGPAKLSEGMVAIDVPPPAPASHYAALDSRIHIDGHGNQCTADMRPIEQLARATLMPRDEFIDDPAPMEPPTADQLAARRAFIDEHVEAGTIVLPSRPLTEPMDSA